MNLRSTAFSPALLWGCQCILVMSLTVINPNHYTTTDSHYYLSTAQALSEGHLGQSTNHTYGTFPLGYALGIALISVLTGLPVLWASKCLNLLLSGFWFMRTYPRKYTEKTLFSSTILLTGPFLKLWAQTWSEPLFLILLFFWTTNFFQEKQHLGRLLGLGTALLLVRYAGIFIIPLAVGMAAYWYHKGEQKKFRNSLILSLAWSLFSGGYLLFNHFISGHWYGGPRLAPTEGIVAILALFGKGLMNELLLFRDSDFQHFDGLFLSCLALQIVLFILLVPQLPKRIRCDKFRITAFAYLLFLLVARLMSPFDQPAPRLLSPFSFLAGYSLITCFINSKPDLKQKWLYSTILLCSWVDLLPQKDWATKFRHLSALFDSY